LNKLQFKQYNHVPHKPFELSKVLLRHVWILPIYRVLVHIAIMIVKLTSLVLSVALLSRV